MVELLPVSAHQRNLRHLAVIRIWFPVPNSVFGNFAVLHNLKSWTMCPGGFGVVPVSIFWQEASPYANYEYVKGRLGGPDEDVT